MPVHEGVVDVAEGLELQRGQKLREFRIAYRVVGPPDLPVIGVLGGISADRRVCGDGRQDGGWWSSLVGPDRAVDTTSYRVLGFDWLGGPGGSTRPKAETGRIPEITTADQANALAAVLDGLGVDGLRALVGASYGGAVSLAFTAEHPDRVRRTLVIGSAHVSHPLAVALHVIQRRIVLDAVDRGEPARGVALARALAMTTYRSAEEFSARFSGPPEPGSDGPVFPVESYLDHHGREFARRFSADEFLLLCQSLDLHDVDPADLRSPVTLVSIRPDTLAPRWQMEELFERLDDGVGHELIRVDSPHGHDAFLTDEATFARILTDFLGRCEAPRCETSR